jgi:hypothetical protein
MTHWANVRIKHPLFAVSSSKYSPIYIPLMHSLQYRRALLVALKAIETPFWCMTSTICFGMLCLAMILCRVVTTIPWELASAILAIPPMAATSLWQVSPLSSASMCDISRLCGYQCPVIGWHGLFTEFAHWACLQLCHQPNWIRPKVQCCVSYSQNASSGKLRCTLSV